MFMQMLDKYGPIATSIYIALAVGLVAFNGYFVLRFVLRLLRHLFIDVMPDFIEEAAEKVDEAAAEMASTRATFYYRLETIPDPAPKRKSTSRQSRGTGRQPAPRIAPSRPAQAPRITTGKQLPAVSSGKRPPSIASRNGGGRA